MSPGPSSPRAEYDVISAQFFSVLGVPVIRGRAFTESERQGSAPVAVVSQELVRRYWPNDEPLRKRVRLDWGSPYFEVIGGCTGSRESKAQFRDPGCLCPVRPGEHARAGASVDAAL